MWTLILELALKLLGIAVDNYKDDKLLKEAFVKFVEAYGASKSSSVALHDSYEAQKKELEQSAPKPPPPPESLL